jgi:hypothetical protein
MRRMSSMPYWVLRVDEFVVLICCTADFNEPEEVVRASNKLDSKFDRGIGRDYPPNWDYSDVTPLGNK